MSNQRTNMDRFISWLSGITVPLLIAALTILWGISNEMAAIASENDVLRVRSDQMERAILEIKASTNQIASTVKDLEVSQSTHTALMELQIKTIRTDISSLSKNKK